MNKQRKILEEEIKKRFNVSFFEKMLVFSIILLAIIFRPINLMIIGIILVILFLI